MEGDLEQNLEMIISSNNLIVPPGKWITGSYTKLCCATSDLDELGRSLNCRLLPIKGVSF